MQTASAQQRRIGRYVLLDELGRGAMGIVYRAQDPLINRPVAVKLLHVAHALSAEQAQVVRERFMREAQTAGGLDHPNIVRIFDVGQDDETGQLYIVMEYIPGPSLEKVLDEQALEHTAVLDLVRQVGSGLDAAHARAIVHRDIKPANILFTEDGVPKIADFGIARISSSHLTQDVRDLGTPIYMSPEQVLGKPLDGRADLFSLGVLAYRLLTGKTPFEGKDAVSVAYQIIHSTPSPVSALAPELPRAIDPVLERILEKEREGRYTSGFEFHEALASALLDTRTNDEERTPARAKRSAHGRRIAVMLGAAALALAAIVAMRTLARRERDATEQARAVPAEKAPVAVGPPALPEQARPTPVRPAPGPSRAPGSAAAPRASKVQPSDRSPARKERKVSPAPPPADLSPATAGTPEPIETPPESVAAPPPAEPQPVAAETATLALSLSHWITRGSVVVWLDGKTILSGEFAKKKLVPFQTQSWSPIAVPSGPHRLSAKVVGSKGKEYLSEALDLDLAPGRSASIRITFKDEALVLRRRDKEGKEKPETEPKEED